MKFNVKYQLVAMVVWAVGSNLLVAVVMKMLANQSSTNFVLLLIGIGLVVFLNGVRMYVWMIANRRFSLSTMYPLTSIFYPLMLSVSCAFGEQVTILQIFGAFLIAFGVFWLGWRVKNEAI
ncbi:MAG: hypothetical protein HND47_23125 [Chloroflexi bacterium]|nr:hypothetical protein [Chloroflexota bacterium]